MAHSHPPRVAFVSLGCPKNLVDSEKMLGMLAEAGYHVAADESDADVMVINTCGFLQESQDEAVAVIREAVAKKRAGKIKRVVVAGCLVSRLGPKLREISAELAEIDSLVGVNNRDDVLTAVGLLTGPQVPSSFEPRRVGSSSRALSLPVLPSPLVTRHSSLVTDFIGHTAATFRQHPHVAHVRPDTARLRLTPRHYTYLRLSEGCNQKCTFCTIPAIRGRMRSKPLADILREADELLSDGAVELNLIGQDTTSYGIDIGYTGKNEGLTGLIRTLDRHVGRVQPKAWLRLMYAYPSTFDDDMMAALADAERFVPYIDMPLQHVNDRILKAMHRRVTKQDTERLLMRLRKALPKLSLRTTLIVGFPGETEAEFAELVDFVREHRFDMLGVFAYSAEPGTPAAKMKGQVPEEVKQERKERLMFVQQELTFARLKKMVGRKLTVLVDSKMGRGLYAARHAGQAPEVDSLVAVRGKCKPGDFVRVEITGCEGYDLSGVMVP